MEVLPQNIQGLTQWLHTSHWCPCLRRADQNAEHLDTMRKFKNMKNYVFVKEIEFRTFKKGKFLVRKILDLDVFVDEVYKYFLLIF